MRQNQPTLPDDALRFLQAFWRPGEVREVRIPKYDKYGSTASGYFETPEALVAAAASYDGKANIYVTLNPVNPALLARANNRIAPKAKNTTSDEDVLCRRIFFLDVDAERPSGISATQAELAAAHELLMSATHELASAGWPDPIICLSGNGYYALYLTDLPNTDESKTLVERVLKALASRYNTPEATIDTTVSNASRIACLIGTLKMKGDSIEERPHRRSRLLTMPEGLVVVEEQQLRALADEVSPTRTVSRNPAFPGVGSRPLLDMLAEAGLDYREQPADAHGILWYHLRECPFHGADYPYECGVGQRPDGAYVGKCFHHSEIGWQEWKQALGLNTRGNPHHQVIVSPASGASSPPRGPEFPRTDAGNAELFTFLYADQLRYDHRRGRWLLWEGHHWSEDAAGKIARLAIEAVRQRYRAAEGILDSSEKKREADFAILSENRHRLEALLALARSLPPLADAGDHWNEDPLLLGVANGVIDLRVGQLRPGRPNDGITLHTDIVFDHEATCPRWLCFIEEIFQANEELINWLQRAVGYSLTGDISEQVLFICHGQGANGKSVFLGVLRALLGAYAYNAPFSTFELHRRSEISNDLAALAGSRLVTSSETNEGARLNEARIKALTGGDPITARFLYGENFTFRPQGKFFLAVNHLPVVDDLSYGFWRRVRLLPFLRTFTTDADPRLEEKLQSELPGILGWAVRGALAWQERGLNPPQAVLAATRDYREESDPLAEFLSERTVAAENCRVLSAEAYAAYQTWARAQGMTDREILSSTAFGRKLGDRFSSKKSNKGKLYLGVGLVGAPVQEVLA